MDTELETTLRTHGHRVTGPRRAVWQVLRDAPGHLTVEQILEQVRANGGGADTASVYRALKLFEELDLARTSRLGETEAGRWELAHPDEHFHLVCETCGDVDHHVGTLVAQIREHLAEGHGFEPGDVELVVTGRCARCVREAS
jgi:Fur family transcriptional regulator, ferric uptake regulator